MRDLLYALLVNSIVAASLTYSLIGIPIVAGVTYLAWRFRD